VVEVSAHAAFQRVFGQPGEHGGIALDAGGQKRLLIGREAMPNGISEMASKNTARVK
jgi:hypothetical protein